MAGFDISQFDVMLAKDGKKCKRLCEIVEKGVYVSPKYDGYRCIAVCSNGVVTLHSRNGTEYSNFPTVIETLEKWCQQSSFVLDGEIMSDDFNKMQKSAFASKRKTTVGNVKFHVFGFIPHDEWESNKFIMPTKQRLDNLDILFSNNQADNVVMVSHTLIHKVEEILEMELAYAATG